MNDTEYIASKYGFIKTFTGKEFYLLNPDPDSICIEDIAHALSNICRFGGHTTEFYSVAQHALLVCDWCPDEIKLEGLSHDDTEAYYGDMVKPFKMLMPNYVELEQKLEKVIFRKFKLKNNKKIWKTIKYYDNMALLYEKRDLKFGSTVQASEYLLPKKKLKPLRPKIVEKLFLKKFEELTNARNSK